MGRFLIAGQINQVRTEEIYGYLEEDELECIKKNESSIFT